MPRDGAGLESSTEERGTRRSLIALTASAIAALGGGLGIPGLIDEAQATKHARRRRRHNRRKRRHAPGGLLNNISLHIQNLTYWGFQYQFWDQKDEVFDHAWYKRKDGQLSPTCCNNGDSLEYRSDWPGTLFWVWNSHFVVSIQNEAFVAPLVVIGQNGTVSSDGWTNGTVLLSKRMEEDTSEFRDTTDGGGNPIRITINRYKDKDARKIYAITVTKR